MEAVLVIWIGILIYTYSHKENRDKFINQIREIINKNT